MKQGTRTLVPGIGDGALYNTARAIACRVRELRDILLGVVALRRLGDEAAGTVEAIKGIRTLRVLESSWWLFEVMAENTGLDAFDVFDEVGAREESCLLVEAFVGLATDFFLDDNDGGIEPRI